MLAICGVGFLELGGGPAEAAGDTTADLSSDMLCAPTEGLEKWGVFADLRGCVWIGKSYGVKMFLT